MFSCWDGQECVISGSGVFPSELFVYSFNEPQVSIKVSLTTSYKTNYNFGPACQFQSGLPLSILPRRQWMYHKLFTPLPPINHRAGFCIYMPAWTRPLRLTCLWRPAHCHEPNIRQSTHLKIAWPLWPSAYPSRSTDPHCRNLSARIHSIYTRHSSHRPTLTHL